MNLIELYLEEIRRQLPSRNRDDILKEIQSTLMDTIEDRNPNPGAEPDTETVKAVLKEFGSPRKVAKRLSGRSPYVPDLPAGSAYCPDRGGSFQRSWADRRYCQQHRF